MQFIHALYSQIHKGTTLPEASPLEDRVLDGYLPEKTISLIYKKLINNMSDPLHALRDKWTSDGIDIDDEDWQEAVSSLKVVTIPARLRLVQLKILHRVYITGPQLVRMGKSEQGKCRRLCGQLGTFMHILWECPLIQQYWSNIHNIITEVTEISLQPEARRCLLNIWEPTDLTTPQTLWVTLGLTIAKRNIAQKWGAVQAPTVEAWNS